MGYATFTYLMLATPTYVSSHLPAALASLAAVVTDSFALVMEARRRARQIGLRRG